MLYDKRAPSLADKIIQEEEERLEQELKNKKKRGITKPSVKKTRRKLGSSSRK